MSSSTRLRVKELLRENGWTTRVLAEKTGISESYLTHVKNRTRRWNEDTLRKLADAFGVSPIDLFEERRQRTDNIDAAIRYTQESVATFKIKLVPVLGEIPTAPSPYNNQLMQVATGYKDTFITVLNCEDMAVFALCIENNSLTPFAVKGDFLTVSPETWTRSGDIAAVEYGNDTPIKAIMKVTYTDEFVVLEAVNQKQQPVALVRGKDRFRIIGKVIEKIQKL